MKTYTVKIKFVTVPFVPSNNIFLEGRCTNCDARNYCGTPALSKCPCSMNEQLKLK